MTDDSLVLTPAEVGSILRVSDVTVRRMVQRGALPRIAGVGLLLIPRVAVEEMLRGSYHARRESEGAGNAASDSIGRALG